MSRMTQAEMQAFREAEDEKWEAHLREERVRAQLEAERFAVKTEVRPLPVVPQNPVPALRLYAKPRSPHDPRRKDVDAVLKFLGVR